MQAGEPLQATDALAETAGISRSRLVAVALAQYSARRREEHITELLDQVYGEQPSGLEPALRRAQGRSLAADEW